LNLAETGRSATTGSLPRLEIEMLPVAQKLRQPMSVKQPSPMVPGLCVGMVHCDGKEGRGRGPLLGY